MSEQTTTSSGPEPAQPGSVTADIAPAQAEPSKADRRIIIITVGIAIFVLLVLVGVVVFLYSNPVQTAIIRDIFIIAMAFMSVVIGGAMVILILQVERLIALLRNEIKPMLINANQTVSTVRGTTVFVSDNLVRPTIGIASFMAGLRGTQQAILNRMSTAGRQSSGAQKNERQG
jgi:hypothetical protein